MIFILHGKGQQDWFTETYEEDRRKALEDRTRFTDAELDDLDILPHQGSGDTDDDTYKIKTFPFPIDKPRQKVDIRVNPKLCGGGT